MANLSNINGKFVVEQTTGYVGVGTTDPNYPIEVLNASAEIALNSSGGSIYRLKSDSTDFFRINKNGVGDRLVIDGGGNVGIGTPLPSAKLSINAGAQFINFSGRDTIVQAANDPTNANIYTTQAGVGDFGQLSGSLVLQARTQGTVYRDIIFAGGLGTVASPATQLMTILGEGRVGIGTSTPSTKLTVNGGLVQVIESGNTAFYGGDYVRMFGTQSYGFRNSGGSSIALISLNGNSYFNGGNVGIGTTTPLVRLQLERTVSVGTSRTAPVNLIYLTSEHPNVGYNGFGTAITHYSRTYQNSSKTEQSKIAFTQQGDSTSTNGSTIDFYTKTLSTGSAVPELRMRVNYNGNVGIGTDSPNAPLDVTSKTSGSSGIQQWSYNSSPSSYRLQLNTIVSSGLVKFSFDQLNAGAGYNNVLVLDRGKIGIGTSTPVGKLFVGPTWNTNNDGNNLYVKNSAPRSEYDPNVIKTTSLGITYSGSSTNLSGPDIVGLTLYNNAGIAGQFSPMLLFSGLEATPSQFKATMAAIYARSPLGTGDSGAWIDGELIFATAGAATQGVIQRMVISKQGNVGLKTNNPDAHSSSSRDLVIGDGTVNCGMTFFVDSGGRGEIRFDESTQGTSSSRFSFKYDEDGMDNNGVMNFTLAGQELWRFGKQTTGSTMPKTLIKGNSSLNMSSSNNMNKGMLQISGESSGSGNYPPITMQHSSNGNSSTSLMVFKDTSSSSFGYIQRFVNNSNTSIGSIRFTSGQNGVSFDTSSDYRLKEDLKDFKALEVVSKVKVYDFKWKSDKSRSFGVMAHELKELIPQAVSGEKDALLEDGAIEVQGVDYSKVIPHLIQSIQELKTEIDILKNKPCKCNCK